uniref:Secreted protein n=1 Tax=Panagrolaimus sp. PS1159 TaxID=55785 RepID=A0AC35F4L8_9BILA
MQRFVSIVAVIALLIPGNLGNSRARAFYALTNHPSEDIIDPIQNGPIIDETYEPLVLLQNAGNDPRCIFCRAGLGKRMSVEVRNSDFRRRA